MCIWSMHADTGHSRGLGVQRRIAFIAFIAFIATPGFETFLPLYAFLRMPML